MTRRAPGSPGAPPTGTPGARASGSPAGRPSATGGGPGTSAPGAGPGLPGAPVPPGRPAPTGVPGPPGPPPAGPPDLEVGTPDPVDELERGGNGEIAIPVANTGTGPARNLVATVDLPVGITVRAGPGGPADWKCTGTGVATCRVGELRAGQDGILRVKVRVGTLALGGPVSGTVRADGGHSATIPRTMIDVD